MKKKLSFTLLTLSTLLFVGCSSLPKELSKDNYKVVPSVLEVNNNKIEATLTATFPEGYIPPKATITVTPVLKYAGKSTLGTPKTYQGTKVVGNNTQISTAGGSYSQKIAFDYTDDMRKAELFARVKVTMGKKETTFPDVPLADGTIATATLASAKNTSVAIGKDKFQRIIEEKQEADIKFLIQQANIRKNELNKDEIQKLILSAIVAQEELNKSIRSLDISSYASPDGGYKLNEKLAGNRGTNTQKELNSELKKNKVDGTSINLDETPEDWDGFKALMEKSNIEDKDLILRVLSMHSDPETREHEIKNLSSAYKEVAEEILPQLRRSKLSLNVEVIGKSDDEITNLVKSNPSALSEEELIYAATLTDNLDEQKNIYNMVKQYFGQDWRGYNNCGVIEYKKGDFAAAKQSFEKANNINSNVPEVKNNLAVMALIDGDVAKADVLLGDAGSVQESAANRGLASIQKGDYAQAASLFGKNTSNNAVVADIMNKDYDAATKALNAQKNRDGLSYYLAAIIAARSNNGAELSSNLSKAIEADPKYKEMAQTEAEFAKYPALIK